MSAKPWRQLHGASYLVTFSQDFPFQPDRQIASCPGCTRLWGMAVNTWTTNKFSQWTVALHLSNWNVFPYFIRPIPTHLSKAGQAAPFQPIFIICFIQIPWLLSLQSIDVWIIFLNFFFPFVSCYLFPQNTVVPLSQGPDLTPSGILSSQQYLNTK